MLRWFGHVERVSKSRLTKGKGKDRNMWCSVVSAYFLKKGVTLVYVCMYVILWNGDYFSSCLNYPKYNIQDIIDPTRRLQRSTNHYVSTSN